MVVTNETTEAQRRGEEMEYGKWKTFCDNAKTQRAASVELLNCAHIGNR
jgi:hypothetical protein